MSKLAVQYCENWPDMPSLTLAKKLFAEHPKQFISLDSVRKQIRYLRGQSGKQNRGYTKNTHPHLRKEAGSYNPFELPESDAKPRIPVELEGKRTLGLFDIHIPYHDKAALEVAIEEGKRRGCDAVLLGGDAMDCHGVSHWVRDPEAREFYSELDVMRSFLGYIREQFPKAKLYYKEGNHEERYWMYMRVKAPEVLKMRPLKELGIPAITMPYLLGLEALGFQWLDGRTKANLGKLSVFHGHEFGKSVFSPVNVARGFYLRAKASMIGGHLHQSSEHTESDVNGKIITTWSVGCLCNLSPEYAPYNRWNNGFAIIDREGDTFHVANMRIHNGKLL